MKDIILIGYHGASGFIPCTFFENQQEFDFWISSNKILEGNFSIYKFKITSFSNFTSHQKDLLINFLKEPSL